MFSSLSFSLFDGLAKLFSHELPGDKFLVAAISGDKLLVGALLHDVSFLKHNDLVRVHNGAESVSNHDDSEAFLLEEHIQGLLDLGFALSIKS